MQLRSYLHVPSTGLRRAWRGASPHSCRPPAPPSPSQRPQKLLTYSIASHCFITKMYTHYIACALCRRLLRGDAGRQDQLDRLCGGHYIPSYVVSAGWVQLSWPHLLPLQPSCPETTKSLSRLREGKKQNGKKEKHEIHTFGNKYKFCSATFLELGAEKRHGKTGKHEIYTLGNGHKFGSAMLFSQKQKNRTEKKEKHEIHTLGIGYKFGFAVLL